MNFLPRFRSRFEQAETAGRGQRLFDRGPAAQDPQR